MLLIPFIILAYVLLYAFAFRIPTSPHVPSIEQQPLQDFPGLENTLTPSQLSFETWLAVEEKVALDRLLANIAPEGRNARDTAPGSVIASPSHEHPNYYFQWIRDAAITTSTLVDLYAEQPYSSLSPTLLRILDDYAAISYRLQHTPNPSGTFADLSGLGEPKFHADGSAFTDSWGRPQRDGPALRALTLMAYLRAYNASNPSLWTDGGGSDWFRGFYNASMPASSTIKADLEYVSHFWRESGFDLWEEVRGLHFFTAMVQLRALREGAGLATAFGDAGAAGWYKLQVKHLQELLPKFWDRDKGHLVATLDSGRSGLDCGILLGSIHGSTDSEPDMYPPYSDEVLVSLLALIRDQRGRFPINAVPAWPSTDHDEYAFQGVGIGRYPEDVYDGYGTDQRGGNPWFLCTSSVSEIFYRVANYLQATKALNVTERGLPFWEALLSKPQSQLPIEPNKTYTPADEQFVEAVARLKAAADAFLGVVRRHADADGALSEQFDRVTGYERGARDLTWSYGALLQAVRARKRL